MWGSIDFDYEFVESEGKGGGLICIWNKDLFQKSEVTKRKDCIIMKGNWKESNKDVCFVNVYAGQSIQKRKDLWNHISAFIRKWEGAIFIFGDFNEVRNRSERRGSVFDARGAKELNEFITKNELEDLKIGGKEFTWTNKKATKMSRLDRVLIDRNMDEEWADIEVTAETRLHSDHTPLIVKQKMSDYGPTPFKLYNSWLQDSQFGEMVKQEWNSFSMEGSHVKSFIILKKLQHIKKEIIKWNQKRKLDKAKNKTEATNILKEMEKKMEEGTIDENDLQTREVALKTIWGLNIEDQKDIKQLNKNKWCLEGDERHSGRRHMVQRTKES